jgi:hypothetical protein
MAEQDLLVMGRTGKPYLDHVRASDRIWQRILDEGH